MTQSVKRRLFAFVAAALVAAIAAGTALAAPGHGRSGNRMSARAGFGPFAFGIAGPGPGAPGFHVFFGGGPGGRGFGIVGMGPGGPGGGTVLSADVLTPAASFLGISVSTLASDLAGGKTLAQEATAKNKTADDLINAIVAAQQKVYDAEKAAGWITDAQETALLDQFKAGVTRLVNVGPPVPPARQPGPLDAAAKYIGISVSDIQAGLKAGKSLGQIATDNGKTVDGLVTALTAQAQSNLDAAVTAGRITAAQEATILADIKAKVTDLVNHTPPTTSTKMKRLMSLYKR